MTTQLANADLSAWGSSGPLEPKRGQKQTGTTFEGAMAPLVQMTTGPDDWMVTPFGASAYQGPEAARLTME